MTRNVPRAALPALALSLWACPAADPTPALFRDITGETGLAFTHFNGMSGEFYMVENVGAGAALLDYDADGDLDLYLVQGGMLGPGKTLDDAIFDARGSIPLRDRLWRNELAGPGSIPRFVDVTDASGIVAEGYGMGAAVADFNGDGHVDLYVTNFGPNQLWLNNGDGTFRDATAASGTADPLWSVSATVLDYDRDGRPDLFVGNYLNFSFELNKDCLSASGVEDYCAPDSYLPVPDRLYRNLGRGRFEDVTLASGVAAESGSGLGVVAADLNEDGWTDLYVANDGRPNFLWINTGAGTFVNRALIGGCALNRDGTAEASRGIDAADFDNDGNEDLFMAHLAGETNTLYVNLGSGLFEDRSVPVGVATPSRPFTGFGAGFRDFDNDGWLDLFIANGAVQTIEELAAAGDPYPLGQPDQLLLYRPGTGYVDVSATAGAGFSRRLVGRGAAFGDLDNDGDVDIVVANSAGPALVLRNEVGAEAGGVGVRAVEGTPPCDVLGAVLKLTLDDGRTLWRRARRDGSYASSSDPRLLVGLGSANVVAAELRWPDGSAQRVQVQPRTYVTIVRRAGS